MTLTSAPFPEPTESPGAGNPASCCVPDPSATAALSPTTTQPRHGGPHDQVAFKSDFDIGRMDGFIKRARPARTRRTPCWPRDATPTCPSMSWGTTRRMRSPTTGHTPTTSCSRTTCSSPWTPGASRPICPSCRTGRPSAPIPAFAEQHVPTRGPGPPTISGPRRTLPPLRLDRPHLAASTTTSAGPTTSTRARARLRDRRDVLPVPRPGPADPGDLEPASQLRHRARGWPAGDIRRRQRLLCRRAHGTLPAVSWVTPSGPSASIPPPRSARAGLCHEPDQHDRRSHEWKSTAIFLAWDDWGASTTRQAPDRRRERLWLPRPRTRHQPVRAAGLHRPPAAELRRLR